MPNHLHNNTLKSDISSRVSRPEITAFSDAAREKTHADPDIIPCVNIKFLLHFEELAVWQEVNPMYKWTIREMQINDLWTVAVNLNGVTNINQTLPL